MRKYRKPYRVRKKKSILRSRFFWLGILLLIVFGAIFYFLFFSGIFQIEKIIVTGDKSVSQEDIEPLIPQTNIFLVDALKIRQDILNSFPTIAEVEIHRGLPDALDVLIIERVAVAIFCEAGKCFLMDGEGVAFAEAPPETDFIRISASKELLDKERIGQLLEIQSKLKEKLNIASSQALFVSDGRLNIETSEGWEIYFNLKGDIDWQIQELSLVLEKQISPEKRGKLEYIDLRFSRVFYK